MVDSTAWNLIDRYFQDNPSNLVAHHLDSYNDFFGKGIFQIFRENNPIRFVERETVSDAAAQEEAGAAGAGAAGRTPSECHVYLGGKRGDKLYFGKPVIYDEEADGAPYPHYMYPNDARLRNMTYGVTIHYDVEVDFLTRPDPAGPVVVETRTFPQIYLGRFPIMLQSNLCILKGLAAEARFNLGECRNDYGGYFIIGGKEKVIVSQEKFGDNMLYVRKNGEDNLYSHSCEVHSVSEDSSKPIRFTSVKIVAPSAKLSNRQIVVDIPNVKKPVPLFVLMRALGVISDKAIIEHCLLDLEQSSQMVDLFIPSVHDASTLFTQQVALEFIAKLTKRQTVSAAQDVLINYFLPHVGEDCFLNKAYFVGFMVYKLLRVATGKEPPTDRDSFKFKRIETSGSLVYDLFREGYLQQKQNIFLKMDKEYYYHAGKYRSQFASLVEDNVRELFQDRLVEDAFRRGFKGNWGLSEHTKRVGLVQDLNRLSWFTHMSHLRKVSLPLDPTAKVVGPHLLHSTQWGLIDPVDTPDGGNIGLHKHLAISANVTSAASAVPLIRWIRAYTALRLLTECTPREVARGIKVFVNGNWIGVVDHPLKTVHTLKLFRRNGVIPVHTSITFSISDGVIYLYTDAGRLNRPLIYRTQDQRQGQGPWSTETPAAAERLRSRKYTWTQVIAGFGPKADPHFQVRNNVLYDANALYPGHATLAEMLAFLEANQALLDYVDTSEAENALIANAPEDLRTGQGRPRYTHCELDPSLLFGVMGNSIIFPEANQFPRNCFSCGQSRQAVSVYHSNAQLRMDKMGVVLNYGQTPMVKSRYLEYINREEQPYGVNCIVAILSYTGYNVEDAILINEGAVHRGLFRTTYYTTYEDREESERVAGSEVSTAFANIESKPNVRGIKDGFDYSQLDAHGLVRENTPVHDRVVLIGKVSSSSAERGKYSDGSTTTKKGQLGFVDKAFLSEGEEGFRLAKVRVREERLPAIGDKMASRAGQKGTLGILVPEEDMPFAADGTRPDLIINPHALPSRMTIGHLVESLFGKACCVYGAYGDCTAFATRGANYDTYGDMLVRAGFHKSGDQLMYSGFTGAALPADVFFGPTYYMRLKHMVKDKINFRATGKRNFLTRQTNQGRANDGGLKIGEMERDGILANGMSAFLNESYMVRGDQYLMAVCNKTGAVAVYNPSQNLFLSPFADGPLQFRKNVEGQQVLDAVSKYGRSFSVVRVPFALKLLMQELQAMNVQMRIITEDNVDQMLHLSYQSRNLDRLLQLEGAEAQKDVAEVVRAYKTRTDALAQQVAQKAAPGAAWHAVAAEPREPQSVSDSESGASSASMGSTGSLAADSPPYAPYSDGAVPGPVPGAAVPGAAVPGPDGSSSPGFDPYAPPPPRSPPSNGEGSSPGFDPYAPPPPMSPPYAPGSSSASASASSPPYAPGSSAYSPPYAPGSSAYSPPYAPGSSAYAPNANSPPYAPNATGSPGFNPYSTPPGAFSPGVQGVQGAQHPLTYVPPESMSAQSYPFSSATNSSLGLDSAPWNMDGGGGPGPLFLDPALNSAFALLSDITQEQLRAMSPEKREAVMREIVRKSGEATLVKVHKPASIQAQMDAQFPTFAVPSAPSSGSSSAASSSAASSSADPNSSAPSGLTRTISLD